MKKIIIFRYATAFGGAERYILNLVQASSKQEFEYLIVTNNELFEEQLRQARIPFYHFDYAPEPFSKKGIVKFYFRIYYDRSNIRKLLQEKSQQGFGVVYCQSLSDKLLVTPSAKALGMKIYWIEHGPMMQNLLWFPALISLYRRMSKLVDKIICVSEFTKQNIVQSGVESNKLVTVYNGTAAVREPTNKKNNPIPVIITTNRLVPEKGYKELLTALSKLVSLPWELRIIGNGPQEAELKQLVKQLQLESRVKFLGFQSNVSHYLQEADIYINPSIYPSEGLPIANIEAMAMQLPIISTFYGGARETVENGTSGYLVEPKDTNAFVEAIQSLLTDKTMRSSFAKASFELWRQKFDQNQVMKSTLGVLSNEN